MKRMILSLLLLATFVLPAFAVDYWGGPPPGSWDRGVPGSTYEHWTFEEPVPGPPESWTNPYGTPYYDLEGAFEWGSWECPPELDPDGMVEGWHCIEPEGGTIVLTIPNTFAIDGAKYIFLQITSSKAPSDVSAAGFGPVPPYTVSTWPTGLPQIQWPGPAPFGGVWYTYNYGIKIEPNPELETISITVPFCTVIDQIVVDTICTGTVAAEESSFGEIKTLFR